VLGPSLLAAVGLGSALVPVTIAVVTGSGPQEAGLASGLINTSQLGGALGLAILGTVANIRTQSLVQDGGLSGARGRSAGQVAVLWRGSRCAVTRIASRAKYGVSWTSTQRCRAGISMTTTSEAATAHSDRGSSSISASDPPVRRRFGAIICRTERGLEAQWAEMR
jgi:hypothetical protein